MSDWGSSWDRDEDERDDSAWNDEDYEGGGLFDTSGGEAGSTWDLFDPHDTTGRTGGLDHGSGSEITGGGGNDDGGDVNDAPEPEQGEVVEVEGFGATGTIYTAPHDFIVGQRILVYGITQTTPIADAFNGIFTILSKTLNTITYTLNQSLNTGGSVVLSSSGYVKMHREPNPPPPPPPDDEDDSGVGSSVGSPEGPNNSQSPANPDQTGGEDDIFTETSPPGPDSPAGGEDDSWPNGPDGSAGEGGTYPGLDPSGSFVGWVVIGADGRLYFVNRDGSPWNGTFPNETPGISIPSTINRMPVGYGGLEPGLPYAIPVTPTWVGPSFIVNSAARRVIDWAGATDFTVTTAAQGTMVGVNGTAVGPWIFYQGPAVTSNALHIIYNGVGTTHNYGNLVFGGLWSGDLYIYAGAKNGSTTNHYLLRIDTTGAITEVPVPSVSKLSGFASTPAPWGAGGPWGVVFVGGGTSYDILAVKSGFSFDLRTGGFGVTRPTAGSVDNQYLSWRTANRSFAQYDLDLGVTYQANNVLPADASTDSLIAVGGGQVVFGGLNTTTNTQTLYTASQTGYVEEALTGTDPGLRATVFSNGYVYLFTYRTTGVTYIAGL
jgi:hypothetical protein